MFGWFYKEKYLIDVPEDFIGFVYKITFDNGDYYIGQKGFYSTRRTKVAGKRNRKVTIKESNWRTYKSSSEVVKARIKQGDTYTQEVLYICKNKSTLNYMEAYVMFTQWVLTDPKALNKNILMKVFHDPKGNYE